MRVGIVSQFSNENLGNKLQNYALQQVLRDYADEVITVINKPAAKNGVDYVKRFLLAESLLLNKLLGKTRKVNFLEFHKRHIRSSRYVYCINKDYQSLKKADRCALYCAGSDQVWKPGSGLAGKIQYLPFTDRERTFSYAASFGVDTVAEKYRQQVKTGLEHINHISVREDAGIGIIEDLTGRRDARVLVDPTMLLRADQWDQVAVKPKAELPKKYLLTYFLGTVSDRRKEAINAKAKALGCQVINLMDRNDPFHQEGPGGFLYLVKNAACVCTDSFHGSVFTFLYGRPLAIMDREGGHENMSSRLETLANTFALRDCIVRGNDLPALDGEPDYTAGYAALEQEREKSKAFLDMVFREAERAGLCD